MTKYPSEFMVTETCMVDGLRYEKGMLVYNVEVNYNNRYLIKTGAIKQDGGTMVEGEFIQSIEIKTEFVPSGKPLAVTITDAEETPEEKFKRTGELIGVAAEDANAGDTFEITAPVDPRTKDLFGIRDLKINMEPLSDEGMAKLVDLANQPASVVIDERRESARKKAALIDTGSLRKSFERQMDQYGDPHPESCECKDCSRADELIRAFREGQVKPAAPVYQPGRRKITL